MNRNGLLVGTVSLAIVWAVPSSCSSSVPAIPDADEADIVALPRPVEDVVSTTGTKPPEDTAAATQKVEICGVVLPVDVDEVECRRKPSAADFKTLAALGKLEKLRILRADITLETLDAVAELAGIEELDLIQLRLPSDGLARISAMTNLRALNIAGNDDIGDADMVHLAKLKGLKRLELHRTGLSDAGLAHIATMTQLEKLGVGKPRPDMKQNISDAGLARIAALTNLKELDLSATKISDAGLAHLKGLTKLKKLMLTNTKVGNAGMKHLGSIKSLEALELWQTDVSDDGLAHLTGLTKLAELSVRKQPNRSHQLTDAGLAHIGQMKALRDLDIYGTKITDVGMAHLAGLTRLEKLEIDDTAVSDAGLAHLAALSNLVELDIKSTKVTHAGLAHLDGLKKLKRVDMTTTQLTDAKAVKALIDKGRALTKTKDYPAAIEAFSEAISVDTAAVRAWRARAVASDWGDPNPVIRAYSGRGYARQKQATDLEGATKDFAHAAKLNDDDALGATIAYNQGQVAELRSDMEAAIAHYIRAQELNPDNAGVAKKVKALAKFDYLGRRGLRVLKAKLKSRAKLCTEAVKADGCRGKCTIGTENGGYGVVTVSTVADEDDGENSETCYLPFVEDAGTWTLFEPGLRDRYDSILDSWTTLSIEDVKVEVQAADPAPLGIIRATQAADDRTSWEMGSFAEGSGGATVMIICRRKPAACTHAIATALDYDDTEWFRSGDKKVTKSRYAATVTVAGDQLDVTNVRARGSVELNVATCLSTSNSYLEDGLCLSAGKHPLGKLFIPRGAE